jgi:hypothetical protein
MASILILTHEYDEFANAAYLIKGLMRPWQQMGHRVRVAQGIPSTVDADVVVLHADLSVLPPDYVEFANRFPAGVNRHAVDLRKRAVSRHLVAQGDGWTGPVVAKSDLNSGGTQERLYNWKAFAQGRPSPCASPHVFTSYPIYSSPAEVPDAIWADPSLVVERFLPERDEKGYYVRFWIFLGDSERCNRICGPDPIVKGANMISLEPTTVPEELRAERERLGFDYGKFDFVVHEGEVILLDANRTPTGAAVISDYQEKQAAKLAQGITSVLKNAR